MVRKVLDKVFRRNKNTEVLHRSTVQPEEYRFAEKATTATELTVKKINEHLNNKGLSKI